MHLVSEQVKLDVVLVYDSHEGRESYVATLIRVCYFHQIKNSIWHFLCLLAPLSFLTAFKLRAEMPCFSKLILKINSFNFLSSVQCFV